MTVRGIRGATTIENDDVDSVLCATRELLNALLSANPTLCPEDLASAWFTTTQDIHAAYPARAARMLGWVQVPLMCSTEIDVVNSLPLCIRVLLHWNTTLPQTAIQHVYLKGAEVLRPDLIKNTKP